MNFNASSGDNLHFDVLLMSKVCYVWAIPLKNDAKFEEELSCAMENDKISLANFDPILESLEIGTLMGSFWQKFMLFELKTYRGVTRR